MTAAEAQLIQGLFVPRERWGWEFVDGGPPAPSPLADQPPAWTEPALPDLTELASRRDRAIRSLWTRLLIPVAFVVFGVLLAGEGGLFFVPAGFALALLAGLPPLARHLRLVRARRRARTATATARAGHEQAVVSWRAEIDAHNHADERRREDASAFFPIVTPAATPRVDVFGGDGNGWASLLATAGCSVLTSGTGILLVDLSERTVGGGLARLAGQACWPVESWDLPRQLDEVALLDGLGPRETGELVADAFGPTREGEQDHHRRALHADLVSAVAAVLRERLTFRRLAEGLRVLEGLDDGTAAAALSTAEAGALVSRMNAFGRGERIPDELRYLRSSLEALCLPGATATARDRSAVAGAGGAGGAGGLRRLATWWPVQGLRVMATSSRTSSTHHKELSDRLVIQAVLHQLRRRELAPATGRDMLIVAGADHLGRPVLGGLARHAEIAGVRLVLLFERLADDTERVLGSQGGSTIIMRLGNGKDATTAAEFIGRGHKFVLSQVTTQVGRSFTTGDSDSVGSSDDTSDTTGTSGGSGRTYDSTRLLPWLQNTSTNTGWQESVTTSRSQTWQRTTNTSVSDSTNDGSTTQRVYEFLIEPTTVQTLPTTAFLLVSPVDGPGRVTPGDCNPGTVLLPRVSPFDRRSAQLPLPGPAVRPAGAWPRPIETAAPGSIYSTPTPTAAAEKLAYRLTPPPPRPGRGWVHRGRGAGRRAAREGSVPRGRSIFPGREPRAARGVPTGRRAQARRGEAATQGAPPRRRAATEPGVTDEHRT
ncbi:hypothetical protein [Candidatus Frankia alpina]|uniref:hypothetical protein n=1 Tax=Candidatus Frankia alpina TaxID=2699483 RepID=UPI0019683F22|nr:hypothetical protein [Candidatus Frankia alpina]